MAAQLTALRPLEIKHHPKPDLASRLAVQQSDGDHASHSIQVGQRRLQKSGKHRFQIRVARSLEDRQRAWALAYEVYREKDYIKACDDQMYYGKFDARPETVTFLAERDQQIIAAVTLYFHSSWGLPSDDVFGDEINALRDSGRTLCELGSLVCRKEARGSVMLVQHLFKLAYLTACHLENASDFVVSVKLRHVPFYRKALLFETLAGPRPYPRVNGEIGVLLNLDLIAACQTYKDRYAHLPASRNLYAFFLYQAEQLKEWVARNRAPLGAHATRKAFILDRPLIREKEYTECTHFTNIKTREACQDLGIG